MPGPAAAAIGPLMRVLGSLGGAAGGGGGAKLTSAFAEDSARRAAAALGNVGKQVGGFADVLGRLNNIGGAIFSMQQVVGVITGVGKTAVEALNPLSGLNAAFRGMVSVFGSLLDGVSGIGQAVAPLVAKASPAHVQMFVRAVDDASAVFGKILIPALQFSTATTRGFADVLFRLSGPAQRLVSTVFDPLTEMVPRFVAAVTPLLNLQGRLYEMFAAIQKPLSDLGRAGLDVLFLNMEMSFRTLAVVLGPAITMVTEFAKAVGQLTGAFAKAVSGFVSRAREWLGLRDSAAGGSVDAAVKNVKFGSVESFVTDAWVSAFKMGLGRDGGPAERTAGNTALIIARLADLITVCSQILEKIPTTPREALDRADRGVDAAAGWAADIWTAGVRGAGEVEAEAARRWRGLREGFGF